jgi:hypothetical protein
MLTDMSNSDMNIEIENNSLNIKKLGVLQDSSQNTLGYVKQDVYSPYHYFITVSKPIYDLKSIVFHFMK